MTDWLHHSKQVVHWGHDSQCHHWDLEKHDVGSYDQPIKRFDCGDHWVKGFRLGGALPKDFDTQASEFARNLKHVILLVSATVSASSEWNGHG